jgi:hypothetical protein
MREKINKKKKKKMILNNIIISNCLQMKETKQTEKKDNLI